MQNIFLLFCFVAGCAFGAVAAWLFLKQRISAAYERGKAELEPERAVLAERLRHQEQANEEKTALLVQAQEKLTEAFKALSADALKSNNQAFLDLAKVTLEKSQEMARGELELRQQAVADLVRPVRESLDKVDSGLRQLESVRTGAYASLTEQVRSLIETQNQLRSETTRLVTALRTPAVRGHWGEMQLKRVVEMAGMVQHCDFTAQVTVQGEDGRLRPDLVIHLPCNKQIVVDAKAPLEAYLRAIEAGDEVSRTAALKDHARQVRAHTALLARKSYWDQFDRAPEFVVLFLPGECFFSAALEQDASLIESGVEQRVILATPTTLIALLRAVAYGWRQEGLTQNALEISRLGREIYKRLSDMTAHWVKVGKSLDAAVEHYNRAIGSLETRVLVTARKFEELETTPFGVELEQLMPVDKLARSVEAGMNN